MRGHARKRAGGWGMDGQRDEEGMGGRWTEGGRSGHRQGTGSRRPPPREREGRGGGEAGAHRAPLLGQRRIRAPTEALGPGVRAPGSTQAWEFPEMPAAQNVGRSRAGRRGGGGQGGPPHRTQLGPSHHRTRGAVMPTARVGGWGSARRGTHGSRSTCQSWGPEPGPRPPPPTSQPPAADAMPGASAYLDALYALGDDVGVMHGHQRDLDSGHAAHGSRPHACRRRTGQLCRQLPALAATPPGRSLLGPAPGARRGWGAAGEGQSHLRS